jgi:DNA-binding transcriptional MerR regulator
MPDEDRYSLTELADLAGVTPRTVRYYLAQGLLPAVGQTGPGSKYDEDHLARLRLIRRLQAEHLPLAEIRRRLDDLESNEIRDLAGSDAPAPPADSALDYIRTVLGGPGQPAEPGFGRSVHAGRSITFFAAAPADVASDGSTARPAGSIARPAAAIQPAAVIPPAPSATAPAANPPDKAATYERSQWERIVLATDIELHLRRPLTRAQNKQVDRLVAIARELLEEDRP